ncbi:hypothetical protein [Sphingomonas sp. BAUL-RG-20F-R05-02]|uniref:hypothetical protein n=1 Tax=Sphingomonas sp. BAUL-RG-20F-R05-02 TaxID=2914830 RepID=UPI001F58637B|nr:hypothetical protein [Sphingomonas sp. BAUL-RG-20F-R05-02]
MRIHSNDNVFAPPVRDPHPSDHDETIKHEIFAFAGLLGFCVTVGIAIASGALPL